MPVWVLDLGPGMPVGVSAARAAPQDPARPWKGRSTLRSAFASVTPSVQWEDKRSITEEDKRPRRVLNDSQTARPSSLTALGLFPYRPRRNHLVGARGREPASARYGARASRSPPHPHPRAPIGPSRRHSVWEETVIDPGPGARLGSGWGSNRV